LIPVSPSLLDLTLVLSPYTFLLGMLFLIGAFKSPTVNCPENLYSLGVLEGLNEQNLPLKDELLDRYVFCQAVRECVRIALEQRLSDGALRYRMRKGGEITGFEQVAKPYLSQSRQGVQ
jgi:hypothetical protein